MVTSVTINTLEQFYEKFSLQSQKNGISVIDIASQNKAFYFASDESFLQYKADGWYVIGCVKISVNIFESIFMSEIQNYIAGTEYQSCLSQGQTSFQNFDPNYQGAPQA